MPEEVDQPSGEHGGQNHHCVPEIGDRPEDLDRGGVGIGDAPPATSSSRDARPNESSIMSRTAPTITATAKAASRATVKTRPPAVPGSSRWRRNRRSRGYRVSRRMKARSRSTGSSGSGRARTAEKTKTNGGGREGHQDDDERDGHR